MLTKVVAGIVSLILLLMAKGGAIFKPRRTYKKLLIEAEFMQIYRGLQGSISFCDQATIPTMKAGVDQLEKVYQGKIPRSMHKDRIRELRNAIAGREYVAVAERNN